MEDMPTRMTDNEILNAMDGWTSTLPLARSIGRGNASVNSRLHQLAGQGLVQKAYFGRALMFRKNENGTASARFSSYEETLMAEIDPDLTFGIEFEMASALSGSALRQMLQEVGIDATGDGCRYHSSAYGGYRKWNIERDGSIRTSGNYPYSIEIVSPILKGRDGLEQVKKVTDLFATLVRSKKIKINKSCGTHVHHGGFVNQRSTVKKLVHLYAANQRNIDSIMAPSRRGSQTYCGPVTLNAYRRYNGPEGQIRFDHHRYINLNLNNYVARGTVEFRQHQGTLEFDKIVSWVVMGQKMIRKAQAMAQTRSVRQDQSLPVFMMDLNLSEPIRGFFEGRQIQLAVN